MEYYDMQQVCLNGHQITDSYRAHPERGRSYCKSCGEETITSCPNCISDIQGRYCVDGVINFASTPVPEFCHDCGKAYPWTERNKTEQAIGSSTSLQDALVLVEHICSRFHLAACQMRQRHDHRPTLDITDEYDVQDLMNALLRVHFDDVRSEEWTPSYAGKSARMDFLLKDEEIVIEIKKTRVGLSAKEVGDQLIIDIERYKVHPSCKVLVCFVYDPDLRIKNPQGLENDLSREDDEGKVKVIIVPKGY